MITAEESLNQHPFSKFLTKLTTDRRLATACGIAFFLLVILLLNLGTMRQKIKTTEMASVMGLTDFVEEVQPIDEAGLQALITDSPAVTVVFAAPSAANFEAVLATFKDDQATAALTRTIYFYPLVYKSKQAVTNYKLQPDTVTAVFFESGQSKRQTVISAPKNELKTQLVPLLNELPLANN